MAAPSELAFCREKEPLPMRYGIGVAGQGGTSIGEAFQREYDRSPAFRDIFDRAETVLRDEMSGFSIQELCFGESPENQKLVEQTLLSHLANTTIYVAKYKAFREEYPDARGAEFILPQSAGECAALAISGMTLFENALLIAKKRGELTEKAALQNPGKMVYVAGLHGGFEELQEVCQDVERDALERGKAGVVAVSNRNSPKELIYSGEHGMVDEVTKRLNRKVIELPISFGSHCDLMLPMVEEYGVFLRPFQMDAPNMTWILNGTEIVDPDVIVERMIQGPTQIVDYQSSVEQLRRRGVSAMIEMTPNTQVRSVVGRYAKNTVPDFQVITR